MADILSLALDFGALSEYAQIDKEIEKALEKATEDLSAAAHAHIVENAMHKLHSLQDKFIQNFPAPEKIDDNTWLIRIPGKDDPEYEDITWIEDGVPSNFDMLPGLLGSDKVKTSKDGNKYLIVPFKHNKKPSQQSAMAKTLAKSILNEMNKRGISKTKIEKNPDGSPKLGTLHKFDIMGPGQKNQVKPPQQGPQGQSYQTKPRPQGQEGPGGRPYAYGVRVIQRQKGENGQVEKNVMTFRTASEKQSGKMWIHPGLEGKHFLEDAYTWTETTFERDILPEIMRKYGLG